MEYLIASFATAGSRYVECIERQAAMWGERYHGFIFDDAGSWGDNCKLKPRAIRKALDRCHRVLWVDSDCTIDPPELWPDRQFDVGYIDNIHPHHHNRISAGFILFEQTSGTERFLDRWQVNQMRYNTDHGALVEAIKKRGRTRCENVSYWLSGRHCINTLAPERGAYAG